MNGGVLTKSGFRSICGAVGFLMLVGVSSAGKELTGGATGVCVITLERGNACAQAGVSYTGTCSPEISQDGGVSSTSTGPSGLKSSTSYTVTCMYQRRRPAGANDNPPTGCVNTGPVVTYVAQGQKASGDGCGTTMTSNP